MQEQAVDVILEKASALSNRRQVAAYLILLYRVLFESRLQGRDLKQVVEKILLNMDAHVPKEKWTYDLASFVPGALMIRLMTGIVKLGLDCEPLMAHYEQSSDFARDLTGIDLSDNIAADIVFDIYDRYEKDHQEKDDGSGRKPILPWDWNKSFAEILHDMILAFCRSGNTLMAQLALDKLHGVLPKVKAQADANERVASLISDLHDAGWSKMADKLLVEFLPAIEAAAFWNTVPLLKIANFLKKKDKVEARRLIRLAKKEIHDVVAMDICEDEFKGEFGHRREILLKEAAVELARNGELKMALAVAQRIEKEPLFKANAFTDICLILIDRGRKTAAYSFIEGARDAADECQESENRDWARENLPAAFMRMGMEKSAMAELAEMNSSSSWFFQCGAMMQVAYILFERNEWEQGEALIDNAIELGRKFPDSLHMHLHEIAGELARLGYDDKALEIVRWAPLGDPDGIKKVSGAIFRRSGTRKMVEFLEKAYDVSDIFQDEAVFCRRIEIN